MKDVEDIFKAIIEFLSEELPVQGGGTISRLNYYINAKNVEKGDNLLDEIKNSPERYILNQRLKESPQLFKNWIDIAVDDDVDINANYDTVAKRFVVSVNALISDNLEIDTFYKSTRMAEVLKDIMKEFFKEKMTYGFMYGEIETNTLPVRVSIEGNKALMSGVVYIITIQ